MIPFRHVLAREFLRFIYPSISIIPKKLTALIGKFLQSLTRRFEGRFNSERVYFYSTIGAVLLLIVFRGISNGSGIFENLFNQYIEETSASVIQPLATNQPTDINSLMASNASDQGGGNNTAGLPTFQDNSVTAPDPASTDYLDSFKADQVVQYTVQSGDTIGSIASDFGISINTIIWANNLKDPNTLSLDQVLKIPPVTGVIYTVQKGDTIASIAKKYKADSDKILSFNNLTDDQDLVIGNELMVPDGELPGLTIPVKSAPKGSGGSGIYVAVGDGQCVAFVQAHGFSNLHGNAYQWAGYINTAAPVAGGVVVLRGGRFGHVALITAVKPSSVQVVEQNYYGPYVIDHREISLSDRSIVGFIQ